MTARDHPPGQRLDYFQELIARSVAPMKILSTHSADFDASIRIVDLGAVQLATYRFPSLEVHRTAKMIRQSDPEVYKLNLIVRGRCATEQDRRTRVFGKTDFSIYDISTPHRIVYYGDGGTDRDGSTAISVQVPRALLPIPANKVKQLRATVMSGQAGIGALLYHHLLQLPRHAGDCRPTDLPRLGTATLDLVSAMLAHHLDIDTTLPPETRQETTYAQIHAFIDRHLPDPALTPTAIAAAHHISLRTLHRLFQANGLSVAEWVRHRRMDRCRRDLTDPALATHSIGAIAARWGFPDNAHFSRAFTAAHGLSPQAYRRLRPTSPTVPVAMPPAAARSGETRGTNRQ
ncbi:helix-turn-helix domain-containing protein [Plantactinospora sp. CA-294935]|uniref:AraC-like ligand-binding domain-containing protein n=1 Tax=Plantactinospora sp. CA-294935 TaxID=3240012 RepID=UPI003D8B4888